MQLPLESSAKYIHLLLLAVVLCTTSACVSKAGNRDTRVPSAPVAAGEVIANDSSFMDLVSGGHLRIVLPVVSSGVNETGSSQVKLEGNTITLSASNLIGYDAAHFSIEGRPDGKVRLRFASAESSRHGTMSKSASAPRLPFSLPQKLEHVRLIYLTRSSRADHNMAIAASKQWDALNRFTEQMKANPTLCPSNSVVSCTWVPAGIAVRPE